MGPIIIFDKSALQSFSIDDAVWFDHFFLGNITPLFYVETLADLEKNAKLGRTPEQVVGSLAAKTPENGVPNVHHRTIFLHELAGSPPLALDGRPVVDGGIPKVDEDGRTLFHFEEFSEGRALRRWREGDFLELERTSARKWRADLASMDFDAQVAKAKNVIPAGTNFSNLESLKAFLDGFCHRKDRAVLDLLLDMLEVPHPGRPKIQARWVAEGCPDIDDFAPYAAHVFKVDLLFYLGIHRGFISGVRKSNVADMAYLYYLPFCYVFVSGDRLHERTVPLFLKETQMFFRSEPIKYALREMDAHFDALPEEIKARGVMRLSSYPPSTMNNAVTQAWDKCMRPDWRRIAEKGERQAPGTSDITDQISDDVKEILRKMKTSTPSPETRTASADDADQIFVERLVSAKKGKWRMLPQEVVDSASDIPEKNSNAVDGQDMSVDL